MSRTKLKTRKNEASKAEKANKKGNKGAKTSKPKTSKSKASDAMGVEEAPAALPVASEGGASTLKTPTLKAPTLATRAGARDTRTADAERGLHVQLDQCGSEITDRFDEMLKLRRAKEVRDERVAALPKKQRKAARFTAKNADKHELYQLSVQSPKEDAQFLARVFQKTRGRAPKHFREDFCGTGLLSSYWLRRGTDMTAEGYDIDPEPISWGVVHNFAPLKEAAERMTFHQRDVREPSSRTPDVRCAQNFSYWIFTERQEMLEYFRGVQEDLADDGVFVIDLHGGPESLEEMEEERDIEEGFTYVWDHFDYLPILGTTSCRIHFAFRDGTRIKNAFKYHWRLWGLVELRDVMLDAGFKQVDCYWEGTDEDGESGNGIFRKATKGENCLSYIAYLVGIK